MTTQSANEDKHEKAAIIILILTAVIWGSTFIITKLIIQDVPVFLFLGLRYLLGLIGFAPFVLKLKKVNKTVIFAGIIIGVAYFLAIMFQTFGLLTTTAGKSGFITGLYAIIIPFLSLIMFKNRIKKKLWLSVIIALIGMAILTLQGESGLVIGDFLTLFTAFFGALMIVLTDKYVEIVDIYLLCIVEMMVITGLSFSFSIFFDAPYDLNSTQGFFWPIMLYMGIIATTLTFIVQNWGQKQLGPTESGLVFALEPVFAALFGIMFGSEILSLQFLIGGGLLLFAIIISEIKVKNKRNSDVEKKINKD